MYRTLNGNLRLWSVIPNVSSNSNIIKTDTLKKEWNIKVLAFYKFSVTSGVDFMEFKTNIKQQNILRGEIYYADLGAVLGSEQGGVRPVVIIQNDIGNKNSPTVIVAPLTDIKHKKTNLPTHVEFNALETGLEKDSIVLMEQIKTLDKRRLKSKIGKANSDLMEEVDYATQVSFFGIQAARMISTILNKNKVNA